LRMLCGRGPCAAIFFSLWVGFVAWYIYKPVPDGLPQPWIARALVALVKFIAHMSLIGDGLGVGNGYNISRSLVTFFSLLPPRNYQGLKVNDTLFGGVPVRTYVPETSDGLTGAMIFFHGGGWILGSTDSHDHTTSEIAQRLNIVIVSVDYRLCPEHPYPAPLDDSLAATLHFYKHVADYGVDPNRIVLAGDSAGGNLAAAVCLKLKVLAHSPQPKLQVLIYPSLQAFDFNLPSHVQNNDVVLGSTVEVAGAVLFYMGGNEKNIHMAFDLAINNHTTLAMKKDYASLVDSSLIPAVLRQGFKPSAVENGNSNIAQHLGSKFTDPFCMPLMANNLQDLPSAYIITAEHDPLRDDGILYAKRLEKAGVAVTWHNYQDGYHGVMALTVWPMKAKVALRMMDDLVQYLDKTL
jgi:neutral cholesterol ester hydrolase 1